VRRRQTPAEESDGNGQAVDLPTRINGLAVPAPGGAFLDARTDAPI